MAIFAFGVLGLIVGSFLNVVVLRRGAKTLGGRSECMSCGASIRWYDNIPVFSWLALGGKCRACGSAISIQYPLVESCTALLFALTALTLETSFDPLSLTRAALACLVLALFMAIAVYDLRHSIIPDTWVYTLTLAAFVYGIAFSPDRGAIAFFVAAGPAVALPLFALWTVSHGRWMGLGDAKLALAIGWLLGIVNGLFAVFLSFIIGTIVTLPLLLASSPWWKRLTARVTPTRASHHQLTEVTMKSEIPFGPFLVISCIIVWLLLAQGIDPLELLGLLP